MSEYDGSERRHDDGSGAALASIAADVRWIREALPKLATVERVNAIEEKLDTHIEDHRQHGTNTRWKIGTWAAALLAAAGLGVNILKKP